MIKLKDALKLAEELEGLEINYSTLRGWQHKGIISDPIEIISEGKNGGRYGLYNKSVVIEIITAKRMQEVYTLDQISLGKTYDGVGFDLTKFSKSIKSVRTLAGMENVLNQGLRNVEKAKMERVYERFYNEVKGEYKEVI